MSTSFDAEDMRPHYVYRCYDAEDQLLYVGCAYDVESRLSFHGLTRVHMVRHATERFATKAIAREAERAAITTEAPLFNVQHNPTRFRKAKGNTYRLVEPAHPLTRWFHEEMHREVTAEDLREAMALLSDLWAQPAEQAAS